MRDAMKDPHYGDVLHHEDGGKIYVRGRSPKMVLVSRRPDTRECQWMRLSTFTSVVVGVHRAAK